ncbi:putative ATP-dependent RNA helicase TDRD12 isoform X2 [Nylanderia fulva]|nr:putative ATP-dependent RNA helicase TDRD12 isoform X2 [Nylanderia fulva]
MYIKKEKKIYCILLVDHGTSIELTRDKFCVVPQNFIPEKYLTRTIGMYNLLPIRMKKNDSNNFNSFNDFNDSDDFNGSNGSKSTAIVVEEWSEEAIEFAKDMLYASKMVYFDHLMTDETNGREYGEFYLIIDNDVVRLSTALIINYYAVRIEGDLLQLIEGHTKSKENIKEHIINTKFSNSKKNRNNAKQLFNDAHINYSFKKFCLSEKVFIQCTTNCGVLNDVRDLSYPKGIHEGWNKCIKSSRPRKIQSYIWPAINNGFNVVAIGSSQCGKTSGCVMAVCGLVAMRQNEVSHSATHPLALILCTSSSEVTNVQSLCMSFLQSFNNVKAVSACIGKKDTSLAASIYAGCQILVATPCSLVRFLRKNKNLLSFDRLSYLVLDNADELLDKSKDSIGELFKKYKVIKNREPQGDNRPILQIIISATECTSQIKTFISAMYNPYICITSLSEAICFKSVCPDVYMCRSKNKNNQISVLMKDNYTTMKTMIVCINAKEAKELNSFLEGLNKKTLLIHEEMISSDIQALQESWKACIRGLYPILICTDGVLADLNFTNIQWLIHHSVMLQFRTKFSYRFSVLLDNLIQQDAKKNCKISIFIDEKNDQQIGPLTKILKRMNVVIPSTFLEQIEKIAITIEKNKKKYAVCDNVKLLGFCQKRNCEFRHYIVPEIDAPMTSIRINDQVILNLMYIHDSTHFSARILEYIAHSSNQMKQIKFSDAEFAQTSFKIQEYYKNVENRKVCTSTDVGDICVLEESLDVFKRIQILRIRYDKNTSEDIDFVDVRCIDTGVIHECVNVCKLMHIPEELSNLPTHVVEIFLAGVAPQDEEYEWNYHINETVHKWLAEKNGRGSYITGKVCLHLGNTIWLDDIQIRTKLLNHPDMIGYSLKKELVKNFAILNDNHIPDLLKLCKISGLREINGHYINAMCE